MQDSIWRLWLILEHDSMIQHEKQQKKEQRKRERGFDFSPFDPKLSAAIEGGWRFVWQHSSFSWQDIVMLRALMRDVWGPYKSFS